MVPSKRLELLRLSALPPQDSVSTNSTTTASIIRDNLRRHLIWRKRRNLSRPLGYFGISEDLLPSAGDFAGDGAEGAGAAGFCAGGAAAPCGTAGISSCCVTPPLLDGIEK